MSTPRRRADELLLAAPTPGWVPREKVIREMERFVMPGPAHRKADSIRRRTAESRGQRYSLHDDHGWAVAVGSRAISTSTFHSALRMGSWEQCTIDGVRHVRHRDWVDPAAPYEVRDAEIGAPVEGGYTIPTLDELRSSGLPATATPWQRAAVVAAHVQPDCGKKKGQPRAPGARLLQVEFLALRLPNLSDGGTLRKYARAWAATGLPRPTPGATVALPTTPFPTHRELRNAHREDQP